MHTTLQCFSIQKGVLYRHLLKSYTISVKASLNEKQYYAVMFPPTKSQQKMRLPIRVLFNLRKKMSSSQNPFVVDQ